MARVLLYQYRSPRGKGRRPGAEAAELVCVRNWDEFTNFLSQDQSLDLLVLDSVPQALCPELIQRIKLIKNIPVLFFEEPPARTTRSSPTSQQKRAKPQGPPRRGKKGHTPQRAGTGRGSRRLAARLEKSREFMAHRFQWPLTLAQIADKARLSVSYFCRKFKEAYGVSPIFYLREQRLNKAAELLEETSLPLTEVARESGFYSLPYFCREFKKAYQKRPLQYRLEKRGGIKQ